MFFDKYFALKVYTRPSKPLKQLMFLKITKLTKNGLENPSNKDFLGFNDLGIASFFQPKWTILLAVFIKFLLGSNDQLNLDLIII